MRKIIYTRPDGGMSFVTPIINTLPTVESITDEQAEQRAWNRLPAYAINPQFVPPTAIPSDRTFRDAWTAMGSSVAVDMIKAREIHKHTLRKMRAPKLADLDVAYMKADEDGNAVLKAQISAKKTALRDVTSDPRIANALTPEGLRAIIPVVLL